MFIRYDDRINLFDFEYLNENYEEILAIPEYIPSIIRSILADMGYTHTRSSVLIRTYSIHRKKIFNRCYYDNLVDLYYLTEILCFITKFPKFREIIKDENYLEELINQCEKEYNINIIDYINNYEDMERLLKDLEV